MRMKHLTLTLTLQKNSSTYLQFLPIGISADLHLHILPQACTSALVHSAMVHTAQCRGAQCPGAQCRGAHCTVPWCTSSIENTCRRIA